MSLINRREFLGAVTSAVVAGMAPRRLGAQPASPSRPNIVLILADDMGYGDLACQNADSKIPTPHLDRLAREGMRLSDAHSPSAVCTPTRYAILTGDYGWRSRLKQHVLWTWDEPLIETGRWTLGGMLREQGYNTACIGKWHLGWDWPARDGSRLIEEVPLGAHNTEARTAFGERVDFSRPIAGGPIERGFDYYFGDDVPNFAPYCFIEQDRVTAVPTAPKPEEMFGTPGPMVPGWQLDAVMPAITERAVAFIHAAPGAAPFQKRPESPFFLYFSLTAPHTPIAPAPAFVGKSMAHRYGDFVHQVDDSVGRIVQALEDTGQAENTILIFTSDNGSPARDGEDMNGEVRSVLAYGHNPSHTFRGIKADIWEGGHRVPFIVRWPGQVPAGTLSSELVCSIDLAATVAEITGGRIPDHAAVDSHNLLPLLTGAPLNAPLRDYLVHHSVEGMFAIRKGKWKYIEGKGSGGWSGQGEADDPPGQLYDMEADPGEQTNLYTARPEVVESLQRLLDTCREQGYSVNRART